MSKSEHVMVFARFPEIGKCKTRLIPALGPEGAASAHRQMTSHTLRWANQIAESRGTKVEVLAHGNDRDSFLNCFCEDFRGGRLSLSLQPEGDLGEKLFAALQLAYENGAGRVAFVGTDCPDMDASRVSKALDSLDNHEVCFIPATDGGYTLLALRFDNGSGPELFRCLFDGIDWGTETVLNQSVAQADAHGFSIRLLPALHDVDHPEDLEVWERAQSGIEIALPKFSIIIPTYDAEPALAQTLSSLKKFKHGEMAALDGDFEVIVVAAGNTGEVRRICAFEKVQLLEVQPNRGQQLNAGAAEARGEILLFLHADTLLPPNFMTEVEGILSHDAVVAGAFTLSIDSKRWASKWVEMGVRWRSRWMQFPYGDQAIFLRKECFRKVGGFPCQPIMEDYELVRRLRRMGKIRTSKAAVTTSGRRWHELGFLRTTLINQVMIAGYHLGFSIEKLARFYRRNRN